jgi:hypothetical protein
MPQRVQSKPKHESLTMAKAFKRPLKVDSWAVGKNPLFLLVLAVTLESAGGIAWGLSHRSSPEFLKKVPAPPPISVWLRLFRDHQSILNGIGSIFGYSSSYGMTLSQLFRWMRGFDRLDLEQRKLRLQLNESTHPQLLAHLNTVINSVKADNDGDSRLNGVEIEHWIGHPEVQFLLRVWVPCLVHYRSVPGLLLYKARNGDLDALEKLLRLDKGVVHDPRIAEQLHSANQGPNIARAHRLRQAIAGEPLHLPDRQSVKIRLGADLIILAHAFGVRFDSSHIRAFYDELARASGDLVDRDLPASPETLSKGLNREKRLSPLRKIRPKAGQKSS